MNFANAPTLIERRYTLLDDFGVNDIGVRPHLRFLR
jgi:hypothetical protein